MPDKRHGVFGFMQDEEGNLSMARLMLVVWTVASLLAVWIDTTTELTVADSVWPLFGGTLLALIGWAGGARIMKHIGGQIGQFASGIAQTVTGRRYGSGRVSVEVSDLPQAKTPEEE